MAVQLSSWLGRVRPFWSISVGRSELREGEVLFRGGPLFTGHDRLGAEDERESA
jgi:hypothetical protein